jgi:hypothetical protein
LLQNPAAALLPAGLLLLLQLTLLTLPQDLAAVKVQQCWMMQLQQNCRLQTPTGQQVKCQMLL